MNTLVINKSKVKVEETKGKTIINIDTQDADIIVNGVVIWSKFDKPEYLSIPPVLRSFIEQRQTYLSENGESVEADVHDKEIPIGGTFYIPRNIRRPIVTRFDYISSLKDLEFEVLRNHGNILQETADKLVKEFNDLEKEILKAVKDAGYKFKPSHGSGDGIQFWWDVIFDLENWNEDAFINIWRKLGDFESHLNVVYDKYGLL